MCFSLYKYYKGKKNGYFNSQGIYTESEVEIALKIKKLIEAKKLKRKQKAAEKTKMVEEENIRIEEERLLAEQKEREVNDGLDEIAEEDEPEESVKERNVPIEEIKSNSTPKRLRIKNKDNSPKNKKKGGRKERSSKGKNSPKTRRSPKGLKSSKSPKNKGKSPKNKGKSPKNKKKKVTKIESLKKENQPATEKSINLVDDLPPIEKNMRATKTTLHSGQILLTEDSSSSKEKKTLKFETKKSKFKEDENSSLNLEITKRSKEQQKIKNLKSPKKEKSSKVSKNSKIKTQASSPKSKQLKKKEKKVPEIDLESPINSSNSRKKQKNRIKGEGVFDQFRRKIKTKAKGEKKSINKSPKRKGNKFSDEDLEKGLNGNALDTEGHLLTLQDYENDDNLLVTQKNLLGSQDVDFGIESDSDNEEAPRVRQRLEDEEDIRILEKDHPNVLEDIQEHTLFLLRAIFDAFDEKGDKITKYFRKNKFSKAFQVKGLNLLDCPEELLREFYESQSNILDANQMEDTDENNLTLLAGQNKDFSMLNNSLRISNEEGKDDPENDQLFGRKRINKYGELEDYNDENGSVDTGQTPIAVDDKSLKFGGLEDGNNKPLEVDLDDSFDCSENDIVVYTKEDLTNYSKNLGLNIVKQRPLPEIGALESKPTTPTGKKKGDKKLQPKSLNKLNKISGIYGSEPANSRINRSKAFGYPLLENNKTATKMVTNKGKLGSLDGLDSDSIFSKNARSVSPKGRNNKKISNKEREARKRRKREKMLEKKALEERKRKFGGLDLNTQAMKDKANLAQNRARKRIAKRAIDYTFFLDYESPYAEYLPDRYREWQPKEPKKQETNYVHPESKHIGDKLDEILHLYKHEAPMSATTTNIDLRTQEVKKRNKSRENTKLDGESAFSFAQHLHPNHRNKHLKFKKEQKSISHNKNRAQSRQRQPVILDEFDDLIQLGMDEDGVQVFNIKKKDEIEESKNPINTSGIQSERGPHLIPTGMDIEENRYGFIDDFIVMENPSVLYFREECLIR